MILSILIRLAAALRTILLPPLREVEPRPIPEVKTEVPPTPVKFPTGGVVVESKPDTEIILPGQKTCVLELRIIAETPDSTISELQYLGDKVCYILEDGMRLVKIPGETRIPTGRYRLTQRRHGGFYSLYAKMYGHRFVVEIIGVPQYTDVLFHQGNTRRDTRGCLLCGDRYGKALDTNFVVHESRIGYQNFYTEMEIIFRVYEEVWLEVIR